MAHTLMDRFANQIVPVARAKAVTPNFFQMDYEGSAQAGAVKVPIRSTDPVVGDYTPASGRALTEGTTTYLTITIDKDRAINEVVDGYQAAAMPDDLAMQRLDAGFNSMALDVDADAIAELEAGGTASSNTTESTTSTLYNNIMTELLALENANYNMDNVVVIMKPANYNMLKKDSVFVTASDIAMAQKVKGLIDFVDGHPIYKSTRLASGTEWIVATKEYCQQVLAFSVAPAINDLTNAYIGSSAVQARYVYANKVTVATAVRVKTFA
jgi:hypothetical protein